MAKKQKLTGWFKPGVKPAHHGDYETDMPGCMRNWNGKNWSFHWYADYGPDYRDGAVANRRFYCGQDMRWRGLAEKPE